MTLLKVKDSKGSKLITNDSIIQFDHFHNKNNINFQEEADKIATFIKENCSHNLYQAILLQFYK